jgi:hypothetical protein
LAVALIVLMRMIGKALTARAIIASLRVGFVSCFGLGGKLSVILITLPFSLILARVE